VQSYLCDPKFSHFDTIPACDRHTQTHNDSIYRASIASRGKNGWSLPPDKIQMSQFTHRHMSPLDVISENEFITHATLCCEPVSVRPLCRGRCVCHTPVLYQNGCTNRAGFWHTRGFRRLILHCIYTDAYGPADATATHCLLLQ